MNKKTEYIYGVIKYVEDDTEHNSVLHHSNKRNVVPLCD